MKPGSKVLLYGKTLATVVSVHASGKRLGVLTDAGKATFVNASNAVAA